MKKSNSLGVKFSVIIASAGCGSRLHSDIPKQYIKLAGKPILRHSLDTFLSIPECSEIKVIIDPQHADMYHDTVKGLDISTPIIGGKTRKNSINNGLKSFSNKKDKDIILIHDAARPFIEKQDIYKLLETLKTVSAASLATPISDSMRYSNEDKIAGKFVDRDNCYAMQTPQGFHFSVLKKAHEQLAHNDSYTDDTGLVSDMGSNVVLVAGNKKNFKITTVEDLKMAESVIKEDQETISAQGFDVHAFASEKAKTIRLAGIDIPFSYKLSGHSDADVVLHAITDALLGTIGAGDIGDHFPPSDPQWKNCDSQLFLKKAVSLIHELNGVIRHIDLTIICEQPKITPHKQEIKTNIAKILSLPSSRVNVKATTTEGLGFTGRGEGIASQAIATISLPRNNSLHDSSTRSGNTAKS